MQAIEAHDRMKLAAPAAMIFIAVIVLLGMLAPPRSLADAVWFVANGAIIFSGLVMLGWLRPAHVGLTAAQVMLVTGTLGMAIGLWIDTRGAGVEMIAAICTQSEGIALRERILWHWTQLPAMHAGMVLGGLAAIPWLRLTRLACRRQFCARFAQNLVCSAWMTLGMALGGTVVYGLANQSAVGMVLMLGSMIAGMVWGMAMSISLYRLYFFWRGADARHTAST